jgi:hypothetical protein
MLQLTTIKDPFNLGYQKLLTCVEILLPISNNVNIDIQVFTKVFIVQHSNSNHVFEYNYSHYKHTLKVCIFRSIMGSILKPITKYINTFVVNHNSFIHKKYLVGQMTFPLSTHCTLVMMILQSLHLH